MKDNYNLYLELSRLIKKKLICDCDKYGIVTAAYITSENDLILFAKYLAAGKNYNSYHDLADKTYYRGTPEWYFLEGYDADDDWASTLHFVTLSEKKDELSELEKHLNALVKK